MRPEMAAGRQGKWMTIFQRSRIGGILPHPLQDTANLVGYQHASPVLLAWVSICCDITIPPRVRLQSRPLRQIPNDFRSTGGRGLTSFALVAMLPGLIPTICDRLSVVASGLSLFPWPLIRRGIEPAHESELWRG